MFLDGWLHAGGKIVSLLDMTLVKMGMLDIYHVYSLFKIIDDGGITCLSDI